MSFAIGSLVKARDREWVVLPDSTDDLLMLRPLGGTDEEVTGILVPLETVESASFDPPDSTKPGDYRSGRLLREAVRLASRNTAGPFRSFGNIALEPRSYQLVPLLMALKLDPVRLLIADDVGIGKTVEALLIAREMLDRGAAKRLTVLCPPHLARQWQGGGVPFSVLSSAPRVREPAGRAGGRCAQGRPAHYRRALRAAPARRHP